VAALKYETGLKGSLYVLRSLFRFLAKSVKTAFQRRYDGGSGPAKSKGLKKEPFIC